MIHGEIVLTTDAEAVETATQGETLVSLTVDRRETDTLGKVVDALIRAVLLALLDDGHRRRVAHALDGTQTETDIAVMVHTKLLVRLVDIRSQGIDLHGLTLIHEFRDFRNLVTTTAHDGRHELGRIVGFEISRLIGHPRVAGSMRLIEGVGGESFPVGPYLLEHLRIVTVLLTALDELGFHGVDDILFLLTHRLTEGVALTTGEVGQQSRQQHHLLLIDRNTISILQVFLHDGDIVGNLFVAMLTTDELRDITHRSRSVEGVHSDECRTE